MLGKMDGRRRRGWQRMRWWMASPTQWTWVWASSRRWRTGKPGVLQSTVKKRHDWATEKQKSTNSWRLITLSKHHTRLSSYKKKKKDCDNVTNGFQSRARLDEDTITTGGFHQTISFSKLDPQKKRKSGTSDIIQFLFIPLHRMGLWSPISVAFMSMLNHYWDCCSEKEKKRNEFFFPFLENSEQT